MRWRDIIFKCKFCDFIATKPSRLVTSMGIFGAITLWAFIHDSEDNARDYAGLENILSIFFLSAFVLDLWGSIEGRIVC